MANINVIVGRPKILVVRASHALLVFVVCFSHPHTFFLSSQMGDPAVGKSALTRESLARASTSLGPLTEGKLLCP